MNNYHTEVFNPPITLRVASKFYISKMLKSFFSYLITEYKITDDQLIGIILKAKFIDGSERSISTFRKGTRKDSLKFAKLFKHLLNVRADYYNSKDYKVTQLYFTFTIYPLNYLNDTDLDFTIPISEERDNLLVKELSNIKYMDPFKLIKLPLIFSGDSNFINQLKLINDNISDQNNLNDNKIKYKLNINHINSIETEVLIVLQEDNKVPIYRFKDKLITIPLIENKGILIERRLNNKKDEIYLIDVITNEILIINKKNINSIKRGFINPLNLCKNFIKDPDTILRKIITLDIEAICNTDELNENSSSTKFEPVLMVSYDFYNNEINSLKFEQMEYSNFSLELEEENAERRVENISKIAKYLEQFMKPKYHQFRIYAHNLSGFDGVFIMNSLLFLENYSEIKVLPIRRDNKLISIKVLFGYDAKYNRFRHHIIFHDSYSLLLSSLEKLSKTFLKDSPELMKLENKEIIETLISRKVRIKNIVDAESYNTFYRKTFNYCTNDCIALANIIFRFGLLVNEKWHINIHSYPTISSLAIAIYLTHYLKIIDLIPRVTGKIYRDIVKAYHGGHTDVYIMYSNKEVYSYDFEIYLIDIKSNLNY